MKAELAGLASPAPSWAQHFRLWEACLTCHGDITRRHETVILRDMPAEDFSLVTVRDMWWWCWIFIRKMSNLTWKWSNITVEGTSQFSRGRFFESRCPSDDEFRQVLVSPCEWLVAHEVITTLVTHQRTPEMIECEDFDLSPQVYLAIMHSLSIIAIPLNVLAVYCIVYKSTRQMGEYKWYLLCYQLTSTLFDFVYMALTLPVIFFPIPMGYPAAWIAQWLSIGSRISVVLVVPLFASLSATILNLFIYRCHLITPPHHILKLSKHGECILFAKLQQTQVSDNPDGFLPLIFKSTMHVFIFCSPEKDAKMQKKTPLLQWWLFICSMLPSLLGVVRHYVC